MRGTHELLRRARSFALDQPDTLGDADCEALRPGLLGQPVNTVTSLAYVGVGVWLASRLPRLPRGSRGAAAAYAAAVAVTGVGSVAYHGPQFEGAQFLHDLPIVGVFGIGAAVPLWRRFRGEAALPGWSPRLGAAMAGTAAVAAVAYVTGGSASPACRPESLLQPHGLWHLGTAAVIGLWGMGLWGVPDADGVADADGADADVAAAAGEPEGVTGAGDR